VPGVGARTVRALARVAEVVHGALPIQRPGAHGGKDRYPFPVPLKVYDRTINVLKTAVRKAKARSLRGASGDQAAGRAGSSAGAAYKRAFR
jgi:hypothetical protein